MITKIEALGFRCLRFISRPLTEFHVLVGPNASGKTTFLDVPALLADLVAGDLEGVCRGRSADLRDLVWQRQAGRFEVAIEARIPESKREGLASEEFDTIRYEVALGFRPDHEEAAILAEKAVLNVSEPVCCIQRSMFPQSQEAPTSILTSRAQRRLRARTVVNKTAEGNDNFYDETDKGWDHAFRLGPRRSALRSLPEDETKFPASTWLKNLLAEGVQRLVLNSLLIRQPSAPGQVRRFKPDGSNLPWVVADLEAKHPDKLQDWVDHLRTALPDLAAVRTVERPEDRHRYLMLRYQGGLEIPSWMASDGTLRLLALTLPAYLPDLTGIFLIEEPENGIHPRAVETAYQSLSSVYGAQVLLATHSPVILGIVEPAQVLCFAKTAEGATDIVLGSEHPALREWRGETSLGSLFASGVLG